MTQEFRRWRCWCSYCCWSSCVTKLLLPQTIPGLWLLLLLLLLWLFGVHHYICCWRRCRRPRRRHRMQGNCQIIQSGIGNRCTCTEPTLFPTLSSSSSSHARNLPNHPKWNRLVYWAYAISYGVFLFFLDRKFSKVGNRWALEYLGDHSPAVTPIRIFRRYTQPYFYEPWLKMNAF